MPGDRVYNTSCDACRLRKVKCDRGGAPVSKEGVEGTIEGKDCTYCVRQEIQCTYLNAKRRRKGRRIAAIRELQLPKDAVDTRRQSDLASTSGISPLASTSKSVASTSTSGDLLGVEGLNRSLMDACFRGYYNYHAPCTSSLHADILAARYTLYFAMLDRRYDPTTSSDLLTGESLSNDDRPMSEILLLAVGCIGAALIDPTIAPKGRKSKFRLQDRFALRFKQLIDADLLSLLQRDETDVVEACYIMTDPFLSVLNGQIRSTHTIDWTQLDGLLKLPLEERDPLRLSPASHEGIIRLVFKTGMHRQPTLRQDCPSGDMRTWESAGKRYLTESEVFRRMRIFWSIFMQDTFYSMGIRRSMLMTSEDYDWDLPSFIERDDGDYNAVHVTRRREGSKESTSLLCMHRDRFTKFDVIQLEMMLRLAFIVRTIAVRFIGPRSQGRGVLRSDVERAVNALSAWFQHVPDVVVWETSCSVLQQQKTQLQSAMMDDPKIRKIFKEAIKAFFIEIIYHRAVFTAFDCVKSYGIRDEADPGDAMLSSIESDAKMAGQKRKAQRALPLVRRPIDCIPMTDEDDEVGRDKEALRPQRAKLDALMMQSFYRVTKIAKEAAELGTLRANRLTSFLSCQCFASWGCEMVSKMVKDSQAAHRPIDSDEVKSILRAVEQLIEALEAVDSFEGAARVAAQLKRLLHATREECGFSNVTKESPYYSAESTPIGPPRSSSFSTTSSSDDVGVLASAARYQEQRKGSCDAALSPDLDYLANQSLEWLQSFLQGRNDDISQIANIGPHIQDQSNLTVTQENDLTAWLQIEDNEWPESDQSSAALTKAGESGLSQFTYPSNGSSVKTCDAQIWATFQWYNAL